MRLDSVPVLVSSFVGLYVIVANGEKISAAIDYITGILADMGKSVSGRK